MHRGDFRRIACALLLYSGSGSAFADQWLPATKVQVMSADGHARASITPRPIASPLAYFGDLTKNKQLAGQPSGSVQTSAEALVETEVAPGRWEKAWAGPLVNDVSPVSALLANGGRFLVTFDNWHMMGYGEDAIVLYDSRGKLVRKVGLTDFLPPQYIDSLSHSVSSIDWSNKNRITDKQDSIVLRVEVPIDRIEGASERQVEFQMDPDSGHIRFPPIAAWKEALATSAATARHYAEEARKAREIAEAPLMPPTDDSESTWQNYWRALWFRYEGSLGEKFRVLPYYLPTPKDKYYRENLKDLRHSLDGELKWEDGPDDETWVYLYVSPSTEELQREFLALLTPFKDGSLKGRRYAFVGHHSQEATVRAAVERTGAEFAFIDLDSPIPSNIKREK